MVRGLVARRWHTTVVAEIERGQLMATFTPSTSRPLTSEDGGGSSWVEMRCSGLPPAIGPRLGVRRGRIGVVKRVGC